MTRATTLIAVISLMAAPSLMAQQPPITGNRLLLTRADLLQEMARQDSIAGLEDYPDYERDTAALRAQEIRERLENGDFSAGDKVSVTVVGEPDLGPELTVEQGPILPIPGFGTISLAGVLRSELQAHLTKELGRWIVNPQVTTARPLVRLAVVGGVRNATFYDLAADTRIDDAIIAAGGFTPLGTIDGSRIIRAGREVWGGDALRRAVERGETLDRMHLQDGDQFEIAEEDPQGGFWRWGQYVIPIVTAIVTTVLIGRNNGG